MPLVRIDQLQQFTAVNLLSDPGAIGGPVIVPSCAQIKISWTCSSGKPAHNVLYGRYSGAFSSTVADANAILTGLTTGGAWTTLATFMGTDTSLTRVSIRNVAIEDQAEIESTGTAAPGTSASTSLPSEVAICVTLKTATAGVSGRGRLYVPNFTTGALGTANVITPAAVTAVQGWANTISGILSGRGFTWVLGLRARAAYTGSTGTQHPAREATSVVVTAPLVKDNHWDSQRRRGLR